MADIVALGGSPPGATSAYRPAAADTAAVFSPVAPEPEKPKAEAAKPAKSTEVSGFNPSAKIDPSTHIVVLTVKGPDGQTIRQIPTEQQLSAYKTDETQAKRQRA